MHEYNGLAVDVIWNMTCIHSIGGVCDQTADSIKAAMTTGVSLSQGKTAILSRCNLSVFTEAVRLTDANPFCRIHFVGVSSYML